MKKRIEAQRMLNDKSADDLTLSTVANHGGNIHSQGGVGVGIEGMAVSIY